MSDTAFPTSVSFCYNDGSLIALGRCKTFKVESQRSENVRRRGRGLGGEGRAEKVNKFSQFGPGYSSIRANEIYLNTQKV